MTGGPDPGREVKRLAQPVPAPPPGVTDVIRRGTQLGLGALGLAGRAAASLVARVPDAGPSATVEPGVLALLPGAVLGFAIQAERRASAAFDVVASRSSGVARVVSKPRVVQRALRPVEDALWRWNEVARREQTRNQAQAAALIPVIVQQATENVIAQLDFVRIVQQVPVDDIVASLDIEAIVARIDLGGVIRESTAGLTTEAVDAVRVRGIDLDGLLERLVDRVLFKGRERDVDVGRPT
ncbi:MAG: hypothetical protein ACHQDE_02780 [Acidimicrobiia bacterium]